MSKGMLLGLLLCAVFADRAQAVVAADIAADTLRISSTDSDTVVVGCDQGMVKINGLDSDTPHPCADLVAIDYVGDNGPNVVDLTAVNAGDFRRLEADGVTLRTRDGDDIIAGSATNDLIVGGRGNDIIDGRGGDDHFVWATGDGLDTVDGGDDRLDIDTVELVGSATSDNFSVAPRNHSNEGDPRTFVGDASGGVQLSDVERVFVDMLGGDDFFDPPVDGFPDLAISFEINGGAGNDTITGTDGPDILKGGAGDDTMVWNGDDGSDFVEGGADTDTVEINGTASDETYTVATVGVRTVAARISDDPFDIDFADVEVLRLNTLAGADTVDASSLTGANVSLEINAGDGNDILTGGAGSDFLHGDGGDDTIVGGKNPAGSFDRLFGDAGNDTIIWNDGDGNDLVEGGTELDMVVINGAISDENYSVVEFEGLVRAERNSPDPFNVTSGGIETLQLNTFSGNDIINALTGAGTSLEVNAGEGNDHISSGQGSDVLHGDAGDDTILGGGSPTASPDRLFGDAGEDTFIWHDGNGNFQVEGGTEVDTLIINGDGNSEPDEVFSVATVGARVVAMRKSPDPIISIDTADTEVLRLNAQSGNDTIDASALTGTTVSLEVNGGNGNDTLTGGAGSDFLHGDGDNDTIVGGENPADGFDRLFGDAGDDTIVWHGGDGSDIAEGGTETDTVEINGAASDEAYTVTTTDTRVVAARTSPNPFSVNFAGAEVLRLNTLAGVDAVDASALTDASLSLEVNAGEGNDILTGGAGGDRLHGDDGNDVLIGGPNPPAVADGDPLQTVDQLFGDEGGDTTIWSPGDGDDRSIGGDGFDIVLVNGSDDAEQITIAPGSEGGEANFRLVLASSSPSPSTVTGEFTEQLAVNANGGDDTVVTAFLAGTEQVLDGGEHATALGDALAVFDFPDEDESESPLIRPGFGTIHHLGFEFEADTGVVRGSTFVDFDRDGLRDANDPSLAGVEVYVDLDNDRRLDPDEPHVVSDVEGSYELDVAKGEQRIRAARPADRLHTGSEIATHAVGPGDEIENDFGFTTASPEVAGLTAALIGDFDVPQPDPAFARAYVSLFGEDGAALRLTLHNLPELPLRLTLSHEGAELESIDLSGVGRGAELGPFEIAAEFVPALLREELVPTLFFAEESGLGPFEGRLLRDRRIDAPMDSAQVVEGSSSAARGIGRVILTGPRDSMFVSLEYAALAGGDEIGASLSAGIKGPATRGESAQELFPLRVSGSDNDAFATGEIPLTEELRSAAEAGLLYFQVHGRIFPDGEIRGQVDESLFGNGFE
jgi:Ca2+-binding RTX toxin-like protein